MTLAHVPATPAAVARSEAANAAQVVSLTRERMRRARCPGRPHGRMKLCPLRLMMAVARRGNVTAAARSLGFAPITARLAARRHRFRRVRVFERFADGTGSKCIPADILQRSSRWREAYAEARDAARAMGWEDGAVLYYATKAADAFCVGDAG